MFYYGYDPTYILVVIGFLITLIAQIFVNSSYKKYKKVNVKSGLKGFEVARKMLDSNGLTNVKIEEVKGELTDHYDPSSKVVRLSTDIYHGSTIASSSVAAHECGHAIQDKENYKFLRFRSALVPIVNFTSRIAFIFIIFGFIFEALDLLDVGIICLLVGLLFQLVTLPVEFNASTRAKDQLEICGIVRSKEKSGVKQVLSAAAFTYVAGFIAEALQILRLVLISRNRD